MKRNEDGMDPSKWLPKESLVGRRTLLGAFFVGGVVLALGVEAPSGFKIHKAVSQNPLAIFIAAIALAMPAIHIAYEWLLRKHQCSLSKRKWETYDYDDLKRLRSHLLDRAEALQIKSRAERISTHVDLRRDSTYIQASSLVAAVTALAGVFVWETPWWVSVVLLLLFVSAYGENEKRTEKMVQAILEALGSLDKEKQERVLRTLELKDRSTGDPRGPSPPNVNV